MRIGIVPHDSLNPLGGGTYQYTETMVRTLFEFSQQDGGDEFVVFAWDPEHPLLTQLQGRRWKVRHWGATPWQNRVDALRRLVGEGPHREAWRWLRRRLRAPQSSANGSHVPPGFESRILENIDTIQYRPQLNRWFRRQGVELMVYTAPHSFAFESEIPYVMVLHDLQHLVHPDCPEVTLVDGAWETREYFTRHGARLATLVLVDSEVGKEDLLHFYGSHGVTADQIRVLPFLPPSYLAANLAQEERERVRSKYGLPNRYFFYPAGFWPYKNHTRIIQALGLLRREQRCVPAVVFSGSHSGSLRERTFQDVMSQAQDLGVREQVYYLGYVPDEDMSALYAEAEALIMPTFLGPTNIPPLEAWHCGCPVIISDIRGTREQMGNAALLVDPHSVESIAQAVDGLWRDPALRQEMIARGRQRLTSYTPADYASRLRNALEEAKDRMRNRQSAKINP